MKTLDEVIFEAPYSPTSWAKDALHYLREYRDKHEEMLQMEEALGYCEMSENRPLTWDELKQMEGKPVWLEDRAFIDGEEYFDSKWAIVCQVKDKFAMLSIAEGDTCFQKCNYVYDIPGTDHWQAYRKERE